jgi:hypothetical protein
MFGVRRVLRWVGAVVVAVIAYVIVFAIGALIWQRLGGNPLESTKWILAAATFCAVLTGTFIVTRENWRAAALAFWLLAILVPVALLVWNSLSGHFTALNLFELAGAVIGGFPAYYAVRIAPLSALKTKHAAGQK